MSNINKQNFHLIPYHYWWDTDITPSDYYKAYAKIEREHSDAIITQEKSGIITDYYAKDEKTGGYATATRNIWLELVDRYNRKFIKEFLDDRLAESKLAYDYGFNDYEETWDYFDVDFYNIWTQQTKGDSMHNPHTHGSWDNGFSWSFVWYVDVDENVHKPTIFFNERCECAYNIPLKQGRFLMWPSDMIHMQPPSGSDKIRSIISGNIKLISIRDDK